MTTPKTTKDFWDEASSIITATEQHPFLVAMVAGTLSMPQFQYYVLQDALYLSDFADCLRRLGRTPGIPETDASRLESFARGAEEAELSLHHSFFREWNIDASAGKKQMPHTLLYTSYMKQIVVTRPYAEGLAVLLPCFWVYAHVGDQMLRLRTELGDTYVPVSCLSIVFTDAFALRLSPCIIFSDLLVDSLSLFFQM
jgi:thiaminase (transcriptional activator TenA)